MAKRSTRSRRARASQEQTPQVSDLTLAEEYRYVLVDLRRLAILAAVLIGGLVVLSFFI
ncbi:MAG TPA: hypothetical protein VKY39_06070 [Aggregatilineales bacterium]|jgi:hypothetical protein|nr:hypothetical protein [Aggregatilineales bacterium]